MSCGLKEALEYPEAAGGLLQTGCFLGSGTCVKDWRAILRPNHTLGVLCVLNCKHSKRRLENVASNPHSAPHRS